MTDHNPLAGMSLDERRQLDRVSVQRRGCMYADLSTAEVQEMLRDMWDEIAVRDAGLAVAEAAVRIIEESA